MDKYEFRRKKQRFVKKAKTIIAIILVSGTITGIGLGAFVIGINEIIGATSSKNWPSVNGTIIRSKVITSKHTTSRTNQTSKTDEFYSPDVAYKYIVNGTSFKGDNIRFGLATNKAQAEAIVRQYQVGKEVAIYYHPENPEKSVLQPGYFGGLLFFPVMGFAGIVFGVFSCWIIKSIGE